MKGQVFNLTVNLVCIGIFYMFFGALISYILSSLFQPFDENWKKQSKWIQLLDVSTEISALIVVAFWLTYIVHSYIPILHVSSGVEGYIESFGGQMVFIYAIFLFMDQLDDKLKHVFEDFFGRK